MTRWRPALVAMVLCVAAPSRGFAQSAEDADLIPGLLGTYSSGAKTVEKIDQTLSHDWGAAAPDECLPHGPFTVKWDSQLLMRQETSYVFHAYVQGAISVDVDGESVLTGERDQPGWISGDPVELSFGLLELAIEFRKTTEDSARVHLFWSSDEFPLEPIPPHLLFREEGRPDLAERERGRQLFAAHRCNRCHRREHDPLSPPGPSLEQVTTGLQDGWLVGKLLSRDPSTAHARMPSFGFTNEEAAAVAAYLKTVAVPVELPTLPAMPSGKETPPDGDFLVKTVGCLACHTVGDVSQTAVFGGGDLSAIGEKRSPEWLHQWLANPKSLNADHRMPVIRLSDIERAQIARTMAAWKPADGNQPVPAPAAESNDTLIRHGRELVERWRCAACHRIPGLEVRLDNVPTLADSELDWDRSCLSSADAHTGRPVYPQAERQPIEAYVASRNGTLSTPLPGARGQSVLEQRNCLGCHERDLGAGIVPIAGRLEKSDERFRGQSQALIPPALTAVGDKLHEQALAAAVRGEQQTPRLPWLHVRMPRFDHAPDDQAALVSFFVGHDRIPAGAPSGAVETTSADGEALPDQEPREGEETLMAGHALTGSGGFNCVACHTFGEYEPRNVALGTKGCDLLMLQDRMRAEFFHRWTRAPLRVIPGMEMPNFSKPVAGVLDGDVDRQLTAVWRAINDPRFSAPTNPTQVEQLLIVQPGDAPHIVRDVFTVSSANGGGFVARPLAVGFGNGHSLLFDLDRMAIRGWTLGDFARQRTEGKSWYWDLAGVDVATGFTDECELLLRDVGTGTLLQPVPEGGRAGKLLRYAVGPSRVEWEQTLSFASTERTIPVTVTQELAAIGSESGAWSGLERTVTASRIPEGFSLMLRKPAAASALSSAQIDAGVEPMELNSGAGVVVQGWTFPYTEAGAAIRQTLVCSVKRQLTAPLPRPELPRTKSEVTTLPGMTGTRLPLPSSIMPTAMAITNEGRLVFTSLKGHVYETEDSDGDGLADKLIERERGLAAPFGVLPFEGGLLVSHKPELLWLPETDGTRPVTRREIWADGWGYSDDYHDWTTGPVQDGEGMLYLGIGSNYSQQGRSKETSQWRGKVLRIDKDRRVEPFAHELRYPQGIAFDTQGRLFVSDQQGVANAFNEINHVQEGRRYGVKSLYDEDSAAPEMRASVQIPHPWTRSVNGIFFLPMNITGPLAAFAGHGVGCEYNGRFLVRFSLQEVGGALQGACYELSRPNWGEESQTFLGPMCGMATASGAMYIGSIFDSGWLGGPNTGEIVRLTPDGAAVPNGIRELRATGDGFEIDFLRPVETARLQDVSRYLISGYTRVWQGSYATPDSGRYTPQVISAVISSDRQSVQLTLDELREGYVYEVNCSALAAEGEEWFPGTGHYTMNRIPSSGDHRAD